MFEALAPYRKAVIPLVISAVLSGLAYLGITEQMTVQEVVTMAVTALFVYLVPNKQ